MRNPIIRSSNMKKCKRGRGLLNGAINKMPIELHLPGYQYCGPGTKLQKRLARGDPGINPLDVACKEHDISYQANSDVTARNGADRVLADKAWSRVFARDASLGERAAAWGVTNAMNAKVKLGMGLGKPAKKKREKRKITLKTVIRAAKKSMIPQSDMRTMIQSALVGARNEIKSAGCRKNVRQPRILPIPKVGGVLPLIPIFAGLSALGALVGGAAGVTKAVNDSQAAKKQFAESLRHNQMMEAIALRGKGLYLKPYKTGMGLHLPPKNV